MKLLIYLVIIFHENMLVFICASNEENYLCSKTPTGSSNNNCENVNDTYTCYENIPAELPPNSTRVELHCIDPMSITNETFRGGGWERITYLRLFWNGQSSNTLSGGIFTGLKHLTALHINMVSLETLDKGVLDGLTNLTILNLDDCWQLNFNNFLDIMSNEDVLPNLHSLALRKTSSNNNYNVILGDRFWKILKRPVKSLDISEMKVNAYDFRILDTDDSFGRTLEIFNLSRISTFNVLNSFRSETRALQNLKAIDLSRIFNEGQRRDALFWCSPVTRSRPNVHDMRSIVNNTGWTKLLENVDTIYMDQMCGDAETLSPLIFQHIKNVSYCSEEGESVMSNLKQLYLRKNNIRVLDAEVRIDMLSSMEFIDFSENGLEYIHPVILKNFHSLKHLKLSNNRLGQMQLRNESNFVRLFRSLSYLEHIKLDNNGIYSIPPLTFAGNTRLTTLDLESNMITVLTCVLIEVPSLRHLNLRNNRLTIIQSSTIDCLTKIPSVEVAMGGNELTCQKCSDYSSVQSLLKAKALIADFDELRCETQTHVQVKVTTDLLTSLRFDCYRTGIIGATVASTVAFVSALCVGISLRRYKRKLQQREDRMVRVVANLYQGNGFAVYMIYSSVDEVFVRSAVVAPLNETLKHVVGVERDLVCIGDEQFRVGWNIYREIYRCMERSNVAVVVISEGFANSVFCDQELDIAMQLKKPVILLLKGDVDINQHSEHIQLLYRTNVRILFEYEGNKLVLKTTWDKICESFLQMG
ncbi:hypothetical protein DPMN_142394 [Dreissena polymorpha]|uniref:TIR domain-containing protein n=1 Tax=Dreissena polymorpha TaxID=45954 RepID=A0A9D4JIL9_DREPO|nr:hypothetical protein DPMN_142394 [Dreissena polymorpha]